MIENASRDIRERSFDFSVQVIESMKMVRRDSASRVMVNQFIRAATSIGANVSEARGSGSRADFKRFYEISLKSARECEYWLRLLIKTDYLAPSLGNTIGDELDQVTSMLVAAVKRLKAESPSDL